MTRTIAEMLINTRCGDAVSFDAHQLLAFRVEAVVLAWRLSDTPAVARRPVPARYVGGINTARVAG